MHAQTVTARNVAGREALTAEAVARADADMQPIFANWRERGKI